MNEFMIDEQREKEAQAQRDRYKLMFQTFPDVLASMLIDLHFNEDIDPKDIAANARRNYGFMLLKRAGMTMIAVPEE